MPTIWRWIIITQAGYFTGTDADFSNLKRDIIETGYFSSQDEAKDYATEKLGLVENDFELCRVVYASLNSSF